MTNEEIEKARKVAEFLEPEHRAELAAGDDVDRMVDAIRGIERARAAVEATTPIPTCSQCLKPIDNHDRGCDADAGEWVVEPPKTPSENAKGERTSSDTKWTTPPALVDALARRFGPFDLDPAASAENAKAPSYYDEAKDGLSQPWFGSVFCNPPYGRNLTGRWLTYGRIQVESGKAERATFLIPARTSTLWWHREILRHGTAVAVKPVRIADDEREFYATGFRMRFSDGMQVTLLEIEGRVTFGAGNGKGDPAFFGSAVVVFDRIAPSR